MNYLKLVNFEVNRFIKIYIVLLGITMVSQIAGVIVKANQYVGDVNQAIYEELTPKAEFLEMYGQISMGMLTRSMWFTGPIALCIAALLFYLFLIWYRDWFGKNTFIYRLLMLPTARLNLFWSKITTIFLMVLGLVAVQLLLLPLENLFLRMIVSKDFRTELSIIQIIEQSGYMSVFIPTQLLEFFINYGIGFMVVVVLFTAILFERSFRFKGMFLGIVYGVSCTLLFLSPILITELIGVGANYFYPNELFLIELALGLIIVTASIYVSHFLIKRKITV
ncbi:hypothetical protein [Virgibacillus halodenitrificans]|uniref:hypothetical protein n=1 Tax=Virgibacillus halodenitrificans TaxID=1482 RepID=UPI002DBCCEB6|nr:hypothetical protein [Virgibacillus halodenitrificans]MEC2159486.1 hypothetical protein [Virgibacillus halodenitrificans]